MIALLLALFMTIVVVLSWLGGIYLEGILIAPTCMPLLRRLAYGGMVFNIFVGWYMFAKRLF